MPVRLNETQIEKIKADFPALTIAQIAGKHGVAWATVKKIVAPESNGHKVTRAPRAARAGKSADSQVEQLTIVWWSKLPLDRRLLIMTEEM